MWASGDVAPRRPAAMCDAPISSHDFSSVSQSSGLLSAVMGDAALEADFRRVTAGGFGLSADAAQDGLAAGVGSEHGEVAVGQPADASDRGVGRSG